MSSLSVSLPRQPLLSKVALFSAIAIALCLVIVLLRLIVPSHAQVAPPVIPVATVAAIAPRLPDLPATAPLNNASAVVAQVNGVPLSLASLTRAMNVEQAISTLLAQPVVTDKTRQLEQLINGELVLQAAQAASFALSPQEQTAALDAWLVSQGRNRAAVVAALTTVGMPLTDFEVEFARLVTIDRFVSQQLAATGLDRAVLLRQWQATAQISFGPAANGEPKPLASTGGKPIVPTAPAQDNRVPTPIATVGAPSSAAPAAALERIGPFTLWSPGQLLGAPAPTAAPATAPAAPVIGLAPGNLAPTFTLPLLAGTQPAANLADWRGQPVVLSFWTTWCPYCRKQTPVLVAAANSAAAASVQFIGINVEETAATVAPYVAEHQIRYPVLLDTTGKIAAEYLVRGYPTTYFLDGDGYVVAKHVGVLAANQLADYLSQLAERASPIR